MCRRDRCWGLERRGCVCLHERIVMDWKIRMVKECIDVMS